MTQTHPETTTHPEVRPFSIDVPEAALVDLRRRIEATQWPEKETVADESQGVPLATMQQLARYWATDYDWRKVEAKLKALPQFITEIDGLDIHFIHVRSKTKVHMAKRDKGASIYGLPRSRVLGYYRYYSPDCREL